MRTVRHRCDVVVVGARCAGSATAMLLGRMGHDVVLVDRATFPRDTLSTHGIARGGVVQLSRWGLLDAVLASGAPAVRQATFRVGDDELVRPIKARAGVDLLVAPRRHILDSLLAQASRDAGADVRLGTTVTGLKRDGTGRVFGVQATDASGAPVELSARFVIGADGLRSKVARLVEAPLLVSRSRNSAAFYTYASDIDAVGHEFHVDAAGMAGVFPTHGGEACVWLCCRSSNITSLLAAGSGRAAALVDAIAEVSPSLAGRLRRGRITSPVRGTVGLPNHVRQAVGPGWALVGDAGYHRDPVTGHGITDAFRDAELLARSLDAVLQGRATDALADYQQQRDTALRDIFALTCALADYPATSRFVQLQKELGAAIETEADALAAQPAQPLYVGRSASAAA